MKATAILSAALLLAASSVFAQGFAADPLKALDGVWHDESRKIDVTVNDGVVVISKFESTHASMARMQYAEGTVLAKLTSFKPDGEKIMRFGGECRQPMGEAFVMMPCNLFDASSSLWKNAKGKPYSTLKIGTRNFYRAADMSSPPDERD